MAKGNIEANDGDGTVVGKEDVGRIIFNDPNFVTVSFREKIHNKWNKDATLMFNFRSSFYFLNRPFILFFIIFSKKLFYLVFNIVLAIFATSSTPG